MRNFHFPNWLINKYSTPFTCLQQTAGHYDTETGKWIEGTETEVELTGVIVPYPESIMYQSGGTISATDKQIISLAKIPNKTKIRYQGKVYTITDSTTYPKYAECYIYQAKEVDAFE